MLRSSVSFGFKLLRSPRELPAAFAALAIGVGLTTACYGVLRAALLTPLPYAEPERLALVSDSVTSGMRTLTELRLRALQQAASPFSALATFGQPTRASLTTVASLGAVAVSGSVVSTNLFDVLGVRAATGRTFGPSDDAASDVRPIVISERLVRSGAASSRVDEVLRLDGRPYRVVGIMPASFWFPDRETQYWTPLVVAPDARVNGAATMSAFRVIARVASAVPMSAAAERAGAVTVRSGQQTVRVEPYSATLTVSIRSPLLALQAGTVLLLVLVGLNVSWLLSARARRLVRTFATLYALGATRGAVLVASAIPALAVAACAAPGALGVAWWLLRESRPLHTGAFAGTTEPVLTMTVGVAAAALTFVVVMLAWLPGALGTVREANVVAGTRPLARGRVFDRAAMTVQIALVFAIASQAILLADTVADVRRVNVGLPRTDFVVAEIQPRDTNVDPRVLLDRYYAIIGRLEARGIPAAITNAFPLAGRDLGDITFGARINRNIQRGMTRAHVVTPSFFRITGIGAIEGRVLDASDAGRHRAMVNDVIAGSTPADAVGHGIGFNSPWTVVGVTNAMRQFDFYEVLSPEAYVLYDDALSLLPSLAVSSLRRPYLLGAMREGADASTALRTAVAQEMPDAAIVSLATMDELIAKHLDVSRVAALAAATMAGVALFLAAAGLFGMASTDLARRRREMGIRAALGATSARLAASMLMPLVAVLAAGSLTGALLGFWGRRAIESIVLPPRGFGYLPFAAVCAVVTVVLIAAFVATCARPTRAAMHVDPAMTLRED